MQTENRRIYKEEWLIDALKRYDYKNIPSNVILDKTLPGLGATYTELHSNRSSIIIEPNVPVILDKAKDNLKWLAVWENCKSRDIEKYLQKPYKEKKLLCTPEGFSKIKKAANKVGVNIYEDYFCLMDECEKFIQDVDYRKRITQPVNDFFRFKNKAMVSATPLAMRHPELEFQNFRLLKFIPDFDYKVDLNLIITNNYDKIVREQFEQYRNSECVCIFLNSTTGINRIINTLGIDGETKVFCSQKSVAKLNDCSFSNVNENMSYPFAKYNFFHLSLLFSSRYTLTCKTGYLITNKLG